MSNWYVFFISTGQEGAAAAEIIMAFGTDEAEYIPLEVESVLKNIELIKKKLR